MPRGTHPNSREAFHAGAALLGARAKRILAELRRNGPGTDRELMKRLGFHDPNSVRPRITELIRAGLVREAESRQCAVTLRKVRVVAAVHTVEQLPLLPGVAPNTTARWE